MTLAAFIAQLRLRAWTLSSNRGGPEIRGLVSRLADRATQGSPPTPEQIALERVLDALRAPERESELSTQIIDQLSAQNVLELEALVDHIERGLITPAEISDTLRRARIHAVPPSR